MIQSGTRPVTTHSSLGENVRSTRYLISLAVRTGQAVGDKSEQGARGHTMALIWNEDNVVSITGNEKIFTVELISSEERWRLLAR